MSAKTHIIYNKAIEIYSDCSEPQSFFGRYQGDNIYLIVEKDYLNKFTFIGDYFYIELVGYSQTEPDSFRFWGGDILKVDFDQDGLLVLVKGGTKTAKNLEAKNFLEFAFEEIPGNG